jgi:hypothetical protein
MSKYLRDFLKIPVDGTCMSEHENSVQGKLRGDPVAYIYICNKCTNYTKLTFNDLYYPTKCDRLSFLEYNSLMVQSKRNCPYCSTIKLPITLIKFADGEDLQCDLCKRVYVENAVGDIQYFERYRDSRDLPKFINNTDNLISGAETAAHNKYNFNKNHQEMGKRPTTPSVEYSNKAVKILKRLLMIYYNIELNILPESMENAYICHRHVTIMKGKFNKIIDDINVMLPKLINYIETLITDIPLKDKDRERETQLETCNQNLISYSNDYTLLARSLGNLRLELAATNVIVQCNNGSIESGKCPSCGSLINKIPNKLEYSCSKINCSKYAKARFFNKYYPLNGYDPSFENMIQNNVGNKHCFYCNENNLQAHTCKGCGREYTTDEVTKTVYEEPRKLKDLKLNYIFQEVVYNKRMPLFYKTADKMAGREYEYDHVNDVIIMEAQNRERNENTPAQSSTQSTPTSSTQFNQLNISQRALNVLSQPIATRKPQEIPLLAPIQSDSNDPSSWKQPINYWRLDKQLTITQQQKLQAIICPMCDQNLTNIYGPKYKCPSCNAIILQVTETVFEIYLKQNHSIPLTSYTVTKMDYDAFINENAQALSQRQSVPIHSINSSFILQGSCPFCSSITDMMTNNRFRKYCIICKLKFIGKDNNKFEIVVINDDSLGTFDQFYASRKTFVDSLEIHKTNIDIVYYQFNVGTDINTQNAHAKVADSICPKCSTTPMIISEFIRKCSHCSVIYIICRYTSQFIELAGTYNPPNQSNLPIIPNQSNLPVIPNQTSVFSMVNTPSSSADIIRVNPQIQSQVISNQSNLQSNLNKKLNLIQSHGIFIKSNVDAAVRQSICFLCDSHLVGFEEGFTCRSCYAYYGLTLGKYADNTTGFYGHMGDNICPYDDTPLNTTDPSCKLCNHGHKFYYTETIYLRGYYQNLSDFNKPILPISNDEFALSNTICTRCSGCNGTDFVQLSRFRKECTNINCKKVFFIDKAKNIWVEQMFFTSVKEWALDKGFALSNAVQNNISRNICPVCEIPNNFRTVKYKIMFQCNNCTTYLVKINPALFEVYVPRTRQYSHQSYNERATRYNRLLDETQNELNGHQFLPSSFFQNEAILNGICPACSNITVTMISDTNVKYCFSCNIIFIHKGNNTFELVNNVMDTPEKHALNTQTHNTIHNVLLILEQQVRNVYYRTNPPPTEQERKDSDKIVNFICPKCNTTMGIIAGLKFCSECFVIYIYSAYFDDVFLEVPGTFKQPNLTNIPNWVLDRDQLNNNTLSININNRICPFCPNNTSIGALQCDACKRIYITNTNRPYDVYKLIGTSMLQKVYTLRNDIYQDLLAKYRNSTPFQVKLISEHYIDLITKNICPHCYEITPGMMLDRYCKYCILCGKGYVFQNNSFKEVVERNPTNEEYQKTTLFINTVNGFRGMSTALHRYEATNADCEKESLDKCPFCRTSDMNVFEFTRYCLVCNAMYAFNNYIDKYTLVPNTRKLVTGKYIPQAPANILTNLTQQQIQSIEQIRNINNHDPTTREIVSSGQIGGGLCPDCLTSSIVKCSDSTLRCTKCGIVFVSNNHMRIWLEVPNTKTNQ